MKVKLSRGEIKKIEHKINSELIKDDSYKYYFCDDGEVKEPIEAYLIDDYYIDFTEYDGFCCLGVIKIGNEKIKHSNYYEFIQLIKERLKHYKVLVAWCYFENKISMRFHRVLKKKFKGQQVFKDNISIVVLREGEQC